MVDLDLPLKWGLTIARYYTRFTWALPIGVARAFKVQKPSLQAAVIILAAFLRENMTHENWDTLW